MEKYLPVIQRSSLFAGTDAGEISAMLGCLSARVERFAKNQFIMRFGDETDMLGLVLSGGAHMIREDFWGNRNIIAEAGPGGLFAEVYACTPGAKLGVSVLAREDSAVLFIDVRRILTVCASRCGFHARLIRNLVSVLAEKNLLMTRKLAHMSQRTTREKLLSYLSAEAARQGGASFSIPFNRQQLADYLSVDRSAMSAELCRMRDEGLLAFCRNSFTLRLPKPEEEI